ncbi:hypothetical protein CPLU01_05699 [Colletotrichum plurivorum]|uniref:Uncharacterized protein n=1 Tax=Colletotrichum plurivorum TaxID=2175906 RepID=A0A8H6NHW0_9PEZI|nr:hypothetical protein CPLU01_05699 [Colletotrichum plurivorum]
MELPQQHQRLLDSRTEAADDAVSPVEIESEGSLYHRRVSDARHDDQSNADMEPSGFTRVPLREDSPRRSSFSPPYVSDNSENDEDSEAPAAIAEGKTVKATHFWWYWDFGGAAVAVICMILIAVTLGEANGEVLDQWPLLISPNTIVAVLTTVVRTAVLVPLGSSISQLKWRHLLLKARPLDHIQLFDGASRGPWGSLLMIRHLLLQSKLACALALATILTLAISPSAQQILEYPSLYQEIPNIDVAIGRADEYFSKGFRSVATENWQKRETNEDLPAFQSQVLQALAGHSSQPQFRCPAPATRCEWEEFNTLAVCRTFRNVTEQTTRKCDFPGEPAQTCNYTISLGDDRPGKEDKHEMMMHYIDYDSLTNDPRASAVLNSTFLNADGATGWLGQLIVIRHEGEKFDQYKYTSKSDPRTPVVFLANFRWCRKTYRRVNSTDGVIEFKDEDVAEEFLEWSSRDERSKYNDFDNNIFATLDGKNKYKLTMTLEWDLPFYLHYLLTSEYKEFPGGRATNEARPDSPMQMQHLLYRADIANLTRNLEAVLTDQVRSIDPGDNKNATMFTGGRALGRVTFIRVRWAWFALPVAAVALALGLFFTTVVLTRQTPLLKDSLLALLFYPLMGWAENEVYVNGPQTNENLQKLAGTLRGRLEIDADQGRYRIVREEVAVKE